MSAQPTDSGTVRPWKCDWQPDDLNPGPECPYCAGEMCGRFDGLGGCQHDVIERHGYNDVDEMRTDMTTPPAIIHVSPYPDWPIDPGELLAAIQERFGDQADAVWDLLSHVRSVPADAGLRLALERAIDALDTVREGLDATDPSAIAIGAQSILRHAAREAHAALRDNR